MPQKRQNTEPTAPLRKYTTRQIMELTEKRRQEAEAHALRLLEERAKALDIAEEIEEVQEEVQAELKVEVPAEIKEEIPAEPTEEIQQAIQESLTLEILPPPVILPAIESPAVVISEPKPSQPSISFDTGVGLFFLVLAMAVDVFIFSYAYSPVWINTSAHVFNDMVMQAAFFILNNTQGSFHLSNGLLIARYFQVSLESDLMTLYTLETIFTVACVFAFFWKMSWVRRLRWGVWFIPLAVMANVFRVWGACYLASILGEDYAARSFQSALPIITLIVAVMGLMLFALVYSSDDDE